MSEKRLAALAAENAELREKLAAAEAEVKRLRDGYETSIEFYVNGKIKRLQIELEKTQKALAKSENATTTGETVRAMKARWVKGAEAAERFASDERNDELLRAQAQGYAKAARLCAGELNWKKGVAV